jgi:peroxiredoxin
MIHQPASELAPELDVTQWFNTSGPVKLMELRGQVVLLHAFQMLCPGCVLHGNPLAQRVHDQFASEGLVTIGLHTVFEHHEAMTPVSLEAFLYEFRLTFPVGVDRTLEPKGMPSTMSAYNMRGTPSLVLIDKRGYIRHHSFGGVAELALGRLIGSLLDEPSSVLPPLG